MILQFFTRRKIQKLFKVTSKYFCIFSNTRPASWVPYITKDFLTCYSCLYYCSLSKCICFDIIKIFQVRLCNGFIPHCDMIPHCDIFIVLLISLKSCRSNLLYAHPKKTGTRDHLTCIRPALCRGLLTFHIHLLKYMFTIYKGRVMR